MLDQVVVNKSLGETATTPNIFGKPLFITVFTSALDKATLKTPTSSINPKEIRWLLAVPPIVSVTPLISKVPVASLLMSTTPSI